MVRPKKNCEKCGKLYRACNLSKNKVSGELLCKRCDKQVGSNKFYSPLADSTKKIRIGNFRITNEEARVLAADKGWKRVNQTRSGMETINNMIKNKNKENKLAINNKEKESKEKNKKFIEGLK